MNIRVLQLVIGLACTFFFLVLALYRVQLDHIGAALAHADPRWIGAAVAAYAINLSLRTRRWQIILRPVTAIPYPVVGKVLLVGYGLNTINAGASWRAFSSRILQDKFRLVPHLGPDIDHHRTPL